MESVGRFFVAVGLPPETRSALASVLADWSGGMPLPGRVVHPENWHLTLRFLGWSSEVALERVQAELDQMDLGPPFQVVLEHLGAFPNTRRATVLWIGVGAGRDRLAQLAEDAEEAAQAAGYEPEERPYRAHLTLSRIRPQQDLAPLLERQQPPPVRFTASEVTLYRSHLRRSGAVYEPVEAFPLSA